MSLQLIWKLFAQNLQQDRRKEGVFHWSGEYKEDHLRQLSIILVAKILRGFCRGRREGRGRVRRETTKMEEDEKAKNEMDFGVLISRDWNFLLFFSIRCVPLIVFICWCTEGTHSRNNPYYATIALETDSIYINRRTNKIMIWTDYSKII